MGRIHLQGARIFPMAGSRPFAGDLYLEGGRIAAVGPDDPRPDWADSPEERRDLTGRWILPGFVQTHVHLCQTLARGAAEGRNLFQWLSEVIWPYEAALDPDSLEAAATLGIHQLLAGGTTTILDMGTTHDTEAVARAVSRGGIRALLGPAAMDRGPQSAQDLLRPRDRFHSEVEDLASVWHGHDDDRIGIVLCPRFIPSVTDEFWKEILGAPEFAPFPIHTHGSETEEEVDEVRRLSGLTPAAYFAALEPAPGRIKMAHGVWLTDEDVSALAQIDAAVLHCPSSNLKLGSGLADIPRLRQAGISVGLGADGAACNNRLDIWQEMRLSAMIQSLVRGPETVDPVSILEMATIGGAEALGLSESIGSLVRGKRADFVILDPEADPGSYPADSPAELPETLLVYSGSTALVQETWVGGRPVYRAEEESLWRAESAPKIKEARSRLTGRLGWKHRGTKTTEKSEDS